MSGSANPFNPTNTLPSNPTTLHDPDAIDALELGARRLDFIGLKFQLADEIVHRLRSAPSSPRPAPTKSSARTISPDLSDINGVNGRIQDIRDTYSLLRDLYAASLAPHQPPLRPAPRPRHYDHSIALWQSRAERFRTAQRQYSDTKTLPTPTDLGLPPR